MNKKFIVLLAIGIFAFGGIFVLMYLNNQRQELKNAPDLRITPNLEIDELGAFEITFEISESEYTLPPVIYPLLVELGGSFTEDEALSFGESFSFTSLPNIVNDVDQGTTYIWANEQDSLAVYTQSRRIFYSASIHDRIQRVNLEQSEIRNIAETFIKSSLPFTSAEYSSITYFKEVSSLRNVEGVIEVEPEQADFYQVNFSPTSEDGKIITLEPRTAPLYVWVQKDGSISKAEGILYKNIRTSLEPARIKSYQEIVESLGTARIATIESNNAGYVYKYDLKEGDIQSANIKEIELVYLIDSAVATQLYPVFLLKGVAEVRGIPGEQNVYLFLPAAIEE